MPSTFNLLVGWIWSNDKRKGSNNLPSLFKDIAVTRLNIFLYQLTIRIGSWPLTGISHSPHKLPSLIKNC